MHPMLDQRQPRLVVALSLLLAACGSGPAVGDGGGGDALVGTWGRTTCCTSSDCASCDQAYTFGADGSFSGLQTNVNIAAASSFPGCTITRRDSGVTYTATPSQITTMLGPSAGETVERTGCATASDNQAATPDPTAMLMTAMLTYSISENTMTITVPGGSVTFTRR